MLKQSQSQKLLQKLSPQQIQLMKLLQIPTVSLDERIKEELEENPALEYASDSYVEEDKYGDEPEEQVNKDESDLSDEGVEQIDLDDFIRREEDNGGDYNYGDDYTGERENLPAPVRVEDSFHEYLVSQLGMLELDERRSRIALQIIGSLDEDGYLRRELTAIIDDLAFGQNIITNEEELNELITQIQQFDPPGICVWTLQECLILQLKRIQQQTPVVANAITILDKYFNEFIKKHYAKIQKSMNLDDDTFRECINCIIRLNPKPGSAYGGVNKAEMYIIPDFYISNINGQLELTLNAANAPELRISEGYKEMMQAYGRSDKKDKRQKEAVLFIKQKIDSAKWFIDAIRQRQQTLLHTMQAIIQLQRDFFFTGDEMYLKPMTLKDVAEITAMDVSTVSRVANSKYVQTEFGTFKLKFFFSEALQMESGEEVSTREVKSMLGTFIAQEEKKKPLSDEKLSDMLMEKGYNIARRTVAKYREQLNIPVARLRKEV